MDVSSVVKTMLTAAGKKQTELAAYFGMAPQSMANKMARRSWSTEDLVKAAAFCGAQVAVNLPDGNVIALQEEKPKEAPTGAPGGAIGIPPTILYR